MYLDSRVDDRPGTRTQYRPPQAASYYSIKHRVQVATQFFNRYEFYFTSNGLDYPVFNIFN